MRTKRFSWTVAALAVVAAGCGAGNGAGEEAVAWTDQVCDALTGFTRAATTNPRIDQTDRVAAVREVGRYLGSTSEELGRSLEALDAVGPSPVEGGDDYVLRLREALSGIHTGFEAARTQLAAVDLTDPAALATAVPTAVAPLQELRNLPDPTEGMRANEDLRTASEKATRCRELRSTGAPADASVAGR